MDIVDDRANEATPPRTRRRLIAVAVLAGAAALASVATAAASSSSTSGPTLQPYRTIVVDLKAGLAGSDYRAFEARYSTGSFPAVQAAYEQLPPAASPKAWLYVDYGATPAQYRSLIGALDADRRVARLRVESFSPGPASSSGCTSSFGAGSEAVPPTTAPLSQTTQPEVVAALRPGTSALLGSYLVSGPVGAMAGVKGSQWNYLAPDSALFELSCDATAGDVEQVVHALTQYPFVQAVQVSIPG